MKARHLWVLVTLTSVSAGVYALAGTDEPADLRGQITTRMRTTLEQSSPDQHQHAGHGAAEGTVICGVRVYGYEPAGAATLTEVKTVYGFHLCGVAGQKQPWDVAVKLAGPVILDMSTDPAGIQAVEATETVRYVDRLWQMFPPRYAEMAVKEALSPQEMTDLRRRYDAAAEL
ncbi:hypothetical protein [Actinoplanes derwentensis]|uniref:Uncharacterized protein n=1 Tax=Actinoplanes derwentensis TaxID=113562 RepID=A0A1H1SR98_9ACTN|nr:hypothetical protein [Actinoplanes derwentensis]GID83234.1 hypothetical protein Ade03nite_21580 [Actinoplanes derwentensis]SDS50378.1 hypothetical protein SAMN04489716_0928 [Actinoplanes derwentensis]